MTNMQMYYRTTRSIQQLWEDVASSTRYLSSTARNALNELKQRQLDIHWKAAQTP